MSMTRAELYERVTRALTKVDQTSPVDAYSIIDGDCILARFWLGAFGDGHVWVQVEGICETYLFQTPARLTAAADDVVARIIRAFGGRIDAPR